MIVCWLFKKYYITGVFFNHDMIIVDGKRLLYIRVFHDMIIIN